MSNAAHRVQQAARDASSGDDLVRDDYEMMEQELRGGPPDPLHPLDEQTLDEQASTQMGEMYDSRRRDAN